MLLVSLATNYGKFKCLLSKWLSTLKQKVMLLHFVKDFRQVFLALGAGCVFFAREIKNE